MVTGSLTVVGDSLTVVELPLTVVELALTIVTGSLTVVGDSLTVVELPLTVVELALTMVTGSLTVVGDSLTVVELPVTVVELALTMVRDSITIVQAAVTIVNLALTVVTETLTLVSAAFTGVQEPGTDAPLRGPSGKRAIAANPSRAFFLLLPVFALLTWLFYLRQNRLYVDHLIFALHFHAFGFVLLLLNALAIRLWDPVSRPLLLLLWIWGFAYLAIALRRVYGGSWPWTAAKLCGLMVLYTGAFFFAILALIPLTLYLL